MHLHLDDAIALTSLTATTLYVEREATGLVAASACLGDAGEQVANGREQAGIGGRVGARCAADGALVDVDDLVEVLHAVNGPGRRGMQMRAVELASSVLVERFVDECGLARARHTGDADH